MNREFDTLFQGKSRLTDLTRTDTGYWQFNYDNFFISMDTFGLWRLLKSKKPLLISLDHGELFGRKKPLDLVREIKKNLKDVYLIQIERDINTGDTFFIFEEDYIIEFFTHSMGYENWDLYINHKQYSSLGGGELA